MTTSTYADLPAEYHVIPDITLERLRAYAERGESVGHFLDAVLTNDLQGAFGRADASNLAALRAIVRYVYNRMPADCHGSHASVQRWQKLGGLEGINTKDRS